MLEPRRQELLRVLGVDQYQLRSARQEPSVESSVVEEKPVEVQPLPDIPEQKPTPEPAQTAEPETTYVKAEKQIQKPLRLLWWQFEDLLFFEEAAENTTSSVQSLQQLAQNIATALGRGPGLNGELNWPPGGDFEAISQGEFLQHFVQGRGENLEDQIKLLLSSEALMQQVANLGPIYKIESLQAMLADPSLKSATWQSLKDLRHP